MAGGTPTTIFAGTTGPKGDRPGPDKTLTRIGMYLVLAALFPVAALFFFLWLGLFYYARLPWWVPAPVAGLALLIASRFEDGVAGLFGNHLNAWGEVWGAFQSSDDFGTYVGENWPAWVGGQVWLALVTSSCAAAVVMGWKWLRRPKWEARNITVGPILKRRFRKTADAIASGTESPLNGVTVGVAIDKRDSRFAGGAPGAPYGKRVILHDDEGAGHTLVVGGSGSGKALDVDTPIPTPDGMRRMGDLVVGDTVFDEFGNPTTVTGAYAETIGHDCFSITFSDGSHIVADANHLWRVRDTIEGRDTGEWQVVSTADMRGTHLYAPDGRPRWEVPAVQESNWVKARPIRAIVEIRLVATRAVRCIKVDSPNSVFLAGTNYVPTHNTTTMLMGMRDVIRRGNGLIVVDCKGGPDVPDTVADWAARYGREFFHWTMHDISLPYDGPAEGPAFYDPIGRGDPSRRKDLILGSQRWDVEYYKTVIGDYLQTLFMVRALVPAREPVDTFKDVSRLLSPEALRQRATNIPRDQFPDLWMALDRIHMMGDQERSGINNMYARLNTITSSIAGPWLRRDPEGKRDIDLLRAADQGHVVVFSLDSSNYEETSALLAGLIVQDLKTVSSALRDEQAATPTHVYIDEFSAVDATNIYGLLAKARDARMPVTLATQALADLKRRDPHFDAQVVGIVSSFLIHRANHEEDARVYAGLSGLTKRMVNRMSVEQSTGHLGALGAASATGSGYLAEEEQYRVDAGVFQELDQGQCVFFAKIPQNRYVSPVQVVREIPALAEMRGDGAVDVRRPETAREVQTPRQQTTFPEPEKFNPREQLPHPNAEIAAAPTDVADDAAPSPVPASEGLPVRPSPQGSPKPLPGIPGLPGVPGQVAPAPQPLPKRPMVSRRPSHTQDDWSTP